MKQTLSILIVIFAMRLFSGQGAQAQDDWTLKSPARKPSPRQSHAMASLGGDQALLFGGSTRVGSDDETWVYDLSEDTWTLKSPATKPSARTNHAMASLGGDQVLLFGGSNGSGLEYDDTWVYDLGDNTWTLKSPATKPSARYNHGMASLGGDQVLLFGGTDNGVFQYDETWVYDLSEDTWTLKSPATKPPGRSSPAASLGGDQVLLFGGYPANDETWVYDLSENTWTRRSPALRPSARFGHAIGSLGDGQALLFGGHGFHFFNDETWVYDLSDNTWTLKSPATRPSGRETHEMASLSGNQMLLFGGLVANSMFDRETWVYTATPSLCEDITSMVARCIGGDTKTVQVRVNLLNNIIHAGERVTITIDGTPFTATIISNDTSSRANFSVPGWSVGDHVVSLVGPPGCLADKHANCVAGDDLAKADPYWDDDAEWMGQTQNVPEATTLLGNYPNPFNPSSNIQYALSEDAHVTLRVYNMLGQLVATLVDEAQSAGYKSVVWNGKTDSGIGVSSGIYIYRMTAGRFTGTKRMLLIK